VLLQERKKNAARSACGVRGAAGGGGCGEGGRGRERERESLRKKRRIKSGRLKEDRQWGRRRDLNVKPEVVKNEHNPPPEQNMIDDVSVFPPLLAADDDEKVVVS